jgi:hypothetical protein
MGINKEDYRMSITVPAPPNCIRIRVYYSLHFR